MTTKKIKIPDGAFESDLEITFPGNRKFTIQYRNYDGDLETGEDATVDIILDKVREVINWSGESMKPAPAADKTKQMTYVRLADQLCINF
jgi:hypothetical protein